MCTDIRLKDLCADSVLATSVEGNGQEGTLASSTFEQSSRNIVRCTWCFCGQQNDRGISRVVTYAA